LGGYTQRVHSRAPSGKKQLEKTSQGLSNDRAKPRIANVQPLKEYTNSSIGSRATVRYHN
jgi:hypothetical protein